MMRKRSSATLLAVAALQASLAQALGLGEITLRSALDQPLDAQIGLRGLGDLNPDQILVRLASQADFERAGVERLYSLTDMRFAVQVTGRGEGVLRVSTERPVREPYLDFVVEVRWPSGRVLREYTVLLDLPTYTPAPLPQVGAPRSAGVSGSQPAPSERVAWSGGGEYTVQRNDTLWSIASRTRPDGVSIQRMMVAIQRANPDAFIRGNMNLIKAGAVLRLPSDAQSVSQAEAVGEVAAQTQDWRGDRSAEAAYDTGAPGEPAASASTPDAGYLKLTGDAAAGGALAAGGEGEAGGAAPGTLVEAQEALAAKEREIAELQSRVASLEEQKETYEKLVQVESETVAGAAPTAQAPAEPAPAQPAPTPVAPPAPEPGLLDRLLGNTLVLAGVLFIGVLAFLFKRQRSITTYQPLPEPTQRGAVRKKKQTEAAPVREEPVMRAEPEAAAVAPVAAAPAAAMAAVTSRVAEPETSDPISEAEIYIAYGRQERALEVLDRALAGDAARTDVRLKLMELLVEGDDQKAFLDHYDWLQSNGENAAAAESRALLSRAGKPHWLHELDAPQGVQSASPEPSAPEGAEIEEPELARLEVEGSSFDADLDLALAEDLAQHADSDTESGLDLELGELDIGPTDSDFGLERDAPRDEPSAHEPLGELDVSGVELPPHEEAVPVSAASASAPAPVVAPVEEDEDLGLLEGTDEIETKLELARAYIDMGDVDGARDILDEVLGEGSASQRDQASALLERIRGG